jgi:hypothetical protein
MSDVILALPFIAADLETAGKAVGCSADTLRREIANGNLTARYLGEKASKPVVLAADLLEWISSRPKESGPRRTRH